MGLEEKHKEIYFYAGATIQECVEELLKHKAHGSFVYGEFNGVRLYSETVTMDSAYMLITGKTKDEYNKHKQEVLDKHKEREQKHKESIPELSKTWIEKGHQVLSEDRWAFWDEIVPIRLRGMYNGAELGSCLAIVEILNTGGTLEDAKNAIEAQDHSGMSFSLVLTMVTSFADRGIEFFEYTR